MSIFITILTTLTVCAILVFLYKKFKLLNKKCIQKIELLNNKLEDKNLNKIRTYLDFYRIIKHIYEMIKPYSISIYKYEKNKKLRSINIAFIYQIKSNGSNESILFTNGYAQVPISNIDIISTFYHCRSTISVITTNNISKKSRLSDAKENLLSKNNIKCLILVNIFDKENTAAKKPKPVGLLAISFKEEPSNINEIKNILAEESKKLSKYITNIK